MSRVCPECRNTGKEVKNQTVNSLTKGETEAKESDNHYICLESKCDVIYFNKWEIYRRADVNVPIWFKDDSETCPICYCSNLSRGEIIEAVRRGKKTIPDIRNYTGKQNTGQCLTKNPIGSCCHNAIQDLINKYSE